MVNLALILLMGQVYTALAERLTKWGTRSAVDSQARKPAQYSSMQFGLRMKINKPLRLSLIHTFTLYLCHSWQLLYDSAISN